MGCLLSNSSQTRSWKVVKILDVEEQEDIDYLRKRGILATLTKCSADLTGKRMVFINIIASMYHNKEERDDDKVMEIIE